MSIKTMMKDVIVPEVLGDGVQAKLGKAIVFGAVAQVDNNLVGGAGYSMLVPSFAYIGDAKDVAEGEASTFDKLTQTAKTAVIKKAVKNVSLTDETILGGVGIVAETEKQLALSLANKIDEDIVTELRTATLTATGTKLDKATVLKGQVHFGEDLQGMFLYISPNARIELLNDPEFVNATQAIVTGVVGTYLGCQVIVSSRVKDGEAFLVKQGAIRLIMKRDLNLEVERELATRSTNIGADTHFVAVLQNESMAVKISLGATRTK